MALRARVQLEEDELRSIRDRELLPGTQKNFEIFRKKLALSKLSKWFSVIVTVKSCRKRTAALLFYARVRPEVLQEPSVEENPRVYLEPRPWSMRGLFAARTLYASGRGSPRGAAHAGQHKRSGRESEPGEPRFIMS
jgi:hypothetical protein